MLFRQEETVLLHHPCNLQEQQTEMWTLKMKTVSVCAVYFYPILHLLLLGSFLIFYDENTSDFKNPQNHRLLCTLFSLVMGFLGRPRSIAQVKLTREDVSPVAS